MRDQATCNAVTFSVDILPASLFAHVQWLVPCYHRNSIAAASAMSSVPQHASMQAPRAAAPPRIRPLCFILDGVHRVDSRAHTASSPAPPRPQWSCHGRHKYRRRGHRVLSCIVPAACFTQMRSGSPPPSGWQGRSAGLAVHFARVAQRLDEHVTNAGPQPLDASVPGVPNRAALHGCTSPKWFSSCNASYSSGVSGMLFPPAEHARAHAHRRVFGMVSNGAFRVAAPARLEGLSRNDTTIRSCPRTGESTSI